MYFQGNAPKSVNLYWRRFAVADIPVGDLPAFEQWLKERWLEKDALMEHYVEHGRFPGDESAVVPSRYKSGSGPDEKKPGAYVETRVKPQNRFEFLQIYAVNVVVLLVINVIMKFWAILKSVAGTG